MNTESLLVWLPAFIWLAAIAVMGLALFSAGRGRRFAIWNLAIIAGAIAAALVLSTVATGLVFINPTERGVVISALVPRGYRPAALMPGLHWIIPLAERVQVYDISPRTYTIASNVQGNDSINVRTKDGLLIYIDASVTYSVDPAKVVELNIRWQGRRFEGGVVRPLARGIIRDTASHYGLEEINSTKRTEFEKSITTQLEPGLNDNDLLLVQFVLLDIHK